MSQTLKNLQMYMSEAGMSQAALSRALDKSTSVVSQYLNGKYAGDVAALERDFRQQHLIDHLGRRRFVLAVPHLGRGRIFPRRRRTPGFARRRLAGGSGHLVGMGRSAEQKGKRGKENDTSIGCHGVMVCGQRGTD